MSRTSLNNLGSERPRREGIRVASAALLLAIAPALPASASAIKAQAIHAASASVPRDLRAWVNFLAGGESVWETVKAPPVTADVRRYINMELATSSPLSTPMVQYLEWRRDLDPTRFDHWHPVLGPELQNLLPTPCTSNCTSSAPAPETVAPPPESTSTTNPPPTTSTNPTPAQSPESDNNQNPSPPPVPEPSTWAMAIVMIGAGAWWRYRDRGAG